MAKKSIILDNGDGRVAFSNTASFYYEDSNLTLTGSEISASQQLNFPNIPANKLVYISGSTKNLVKVVDGTVNKGALVWNSTTSQWSASSDIVESYTGQTDGNYLSGSFNDPGGVKVINISSVSSGTLPTGYGGTGANIPAGNNVLLVAKSGSYSYLSASASASGSVVTATSNGWALMQPAYQPDVRFYTSGSTGNTFTWTKPAGAKFARVILQGAGGGGGGSRCGASIYNGSGGGAGAFTDVVIDVSAISTASVTAGIGGQGGANAFNAVPTSGVAGGNSTVDANGIALSAGGGAGGLSATANTGRAGGAGGLAMSVSSGGYSKTGGAGAPNGTSVSVPYYTAYGICGGGGAGGFNNGPEIITMIQSTCFGYTTTSDGIDISTLNFKKAKSSDYSPGATADYGVGGTAAAGSAANIGGNSCNGGNGYILIISW